MNFFERPKFWSISKNAQCIDDAYLFRDDCLIRTQSVLDYVIRFPLRQDLKSELKRFAQGRKIILDAGSDPYSNNELKSLIEKYDLTGSVIVLIQDKDFAKQYRHLGFRWFPTWFIKAVNQHLIKTYDLPKDFWQRRTYNVSCQNRLPRIHRFYTYYLLRQQPWFNEIFLSFGGYKLPGVSGSIDVWQKIVRDNLGDKIADFLEQESKLWPIKWDKDYEWPDMVFQHDPMSPAHSKCYMNIVTETSCDFYCPTEKTTKCLQTGNLFVEIASKNHVTNLKQLGFDIDFDGIDISYDKVDDWQQRAQLAIKTVNKIYADIPSIWYANLERLKFNRDRFRSAELVKLLLSDVDDIIKK